MPVERMKSFIACSEARLWPLAMLANHSTSAAARLELMVLDGEGRSGSDTGRCLLSINLL